ncbi:MAG: helix-turn-helix transcriptional regulator [Deltaproteobacteria bacterium]|nr:helix-turn-helix transcriptional regulator [Deltaproteobacteria bacterium]
MRIGRKIETSRRKKGWSREALSVKTRRCVSAATIKRIEKIKSYNISSAKLIALCKALEIDIGDLNSRRH